MSKVPRIDKTDVESGWNDNVANVVEKYIEDIDDDYEYGVGEEFQAFKDAACTIAFNALDNYINTAKHIVEYATDPDKFILGLGPIGRDKCCIHTDGNGGYTLHAAKIGNTPWFQKDLISDIRYGKVVMVMSPDNECFGDDIATAEEAKNFIFANKDKKPFSWFMTMITLAKKIRKREDYIIKQFREQLKNRISEQNGIPTEDEEDDENGLY